jgi:DNA-directed RNA polymerase specialized sigma24 family protein
MQTSIRKEALKRTVSMLTRRGVKVTFRGVTPYVAADKRTGKVSHLNLPEIPDEPSQMLIDALQGYVDHECGHIFYTPFKRIPNDNSRAKLANIFEDIRLEKMLPRDLPGTKDNLERMYVNWIPLLIQPGVDKAIEAKDPSHIAAVLLVPTMRALGGQKVFIDLMDRNAYWPHMKPLLDRLPGFGTQIQAMETYDDVLACVLALDKALTPPPPPPPPPAPPAPPPPPPSDDNQDDEPEQDDEPQKGDGDGQGEREDDAENDTQPNDDDEPGTEPGADGEDEGDDSEGGDDDEGDASDEGGEPDDGEPAGDDQSDDDGAGTESDDADDTDDGQDGADEGDGDDGPQDNCGGGSSGSGNDQGDRDDDEPAGSDEDGDRNVTMTDALAMLDPTLRRALFMQKKLKKSVDEIAGELNVGVSEVEQMLRDARRELARILRS